MKIKVVVSESVKLDLLEAAHWYENAKKGLGKAFLLDIRNEKIRIAKNPKAFEIRYDSIRIAFTKKFPYGIHYEFFEETGLLIIHAVFHTSRNPDNWKR
jgi:plasmid stabilization system protein ParE